MRWTTAVKLRDETKGCWKPKQRLTAFRMCRVDHYGLSLWAVWTGNIVVVVVGLRGSCSLVHGGLQELGGANEAANAKKKKQGNKQTTDKLRP